MHRFLNTYFHELVMKMGINICQASLTQIWEHIVEKLQDADWNFTAILGYGPQIFVLQKFHRRSNLQEFSLDAFDDNRRIQIILALQNEAECVGLD